MHLVTRHGAIAAAHAQIHVHHEQIGAVHDSGANLFTDRDDNIRVANRFQAHIIVGV